MNFMNAGHSRTRADAHDASGTKTMGQTRRQQIASLFERHNERLVKLMAMKLGSSQEARDVVQEAYVRLLGLGDDRIVGELQAYLYRTAYNIAIDRIRQRSRGREPHPVHINVDDTTLESSDPPAEQLLEEEQRSTLIRKYMSELPPKCRMAFMLFKFEFMTYSEIASRLDLTESMVRKYVLRAARHCHQRISRQG